MREHAHRTSLDTYAHPPISPADEVVRVELDLTVPIGNNNRNNNISPAEDAAKVEKKTRKVCGAERNRRLDFFLSQ